MPVPGMKLRMSWHGDGTPSISIISPVVDGRRHGSILQLEPSRTIAPGDAGQQPSTAGIKDCVQNGWLALSLRFARTDQTGDILVRCSLYLVDHVMTETNVAPDADARDVSRRS